MDNELNLFSVTYERITEESAEHGDFDETGYCAKNLSLREAIDVMEPYGCHVEPDSFPCDRPRWLTAYGVNQGTREFHEQGVRENRSLHIPETVTRASARRIARLLDVYGF